MARLSVPSFVAHNIERGTLTMVPNVQRGNNGLKAFSAVPFPPVLCFEFKKWSNRLCKGFRSCYVHCRHMGNEIEPAINERAWFARRPSCQTYYAVYEFYICFSGPFAYVHAAYKDEGRLTYLLINLKFIIQLAAQVLFRKAFCTPTYGTLTRHLAERLATAHSRAPVRSYPIFKPTKSLIIYLNLQLSYV